MLSVIIPSYNEEKMISKAAAKIGAVLTEASIEFELIFVDDGSKDNTWGEIQKISGADGGIGRVRGLHFSRNFGKEAAMFAGLEASKGDAVAVIDCDLQHPAEKLVPMYELWQEGYEVIEGIKLDRGEESVGHKLFSLLFYNLMSKSSGFNMRNSSDFKMLDRKVVDTLNALPEKNVFFRALSFWSGYKRTEIKYEVADRIEGESKWSFFKLLKYAINNFTSFSSIPLEIITGLGGFTLFIAVVMTIIALVQKFAGVAADGFTTVIILLLFIGSMIMISLGIIGIYIAKIYDEVKGRPRYIVSQACGEEK